MLSLLVCLQSLSKMGKISCWSLNKNHCQKKLTAVGPTAGVCVVLQKCRAAGAVLSESTGVILAPLDSLFVQPACLATLTLW